jgi:hypothetical protein
MLSNPSRPSVKGTCSAYTVFENNVSGICGVVSNLPTEAEVSRTVFIGEMTERSGVIDSVFWYAPPLGDENTQGTRHGDSFYLNNRKARNSVIARSVGPLAGYLKLSSPSLLRLSFSSPTFSLFNLQVSDSPSLLLTACVGPSKWSLPRFTLLLCRLRVREELP